MSPRDTRTGKVLEEMILPALARGGYTFKKSVNIGKRLGAGGRHIVDVLAEKDGKEWLISMKWQQTAGTAEQKVPFEVLCLKVAVEEGNYQRAYLVLGGDGWTLRDFFTSGGLKDYISDIDMVEIMTLESFIAKANHAKL